MNSMNLFNVPGAERDVHVFNHVILTNPRSLSNEQLLAAVQNSEQMATLCGLVKEKALEVLSKRHEKANMLDYTITVETAGLSGDIYIRGSHAPLNWDKGMKMTSATVTEEQGVKDEVIGGVQDKQVYVTVKQFHTAQILVPNSIDPKTVQFKLSLNDNRWEVLANNGNRTLEGRSNTIQKPNFQI